jgi:cyanophycinase
MFDYILMKVHFAVCLLTLALASTSHAATVGPSRGTLMIVGGGTLGPELVDKFFALAGGKDAPIVVIPTADGAAEYKPDYLAKTFLGKAGATHLTLLHTKDRMVADSSEFVVPLKTAKAVWFVGGRQWHLVDSYLNTRTQKELYALLKRGGLIGGSSAGATIMGSYLVRGARAGNELMMAPGYEEGMGFLKQAAIDQHILTRKREHDMAAVVKAHPELLGIGIDESTAIVVNGNRFSVLGKSKVAITTAGAEMYFLKSGDVFDLKQRKQVSPK